MSKIKRVQGAEKPEETASHGPLGTRKHESSKAKAIADKADLVAKEKKDNPAAKKDCPAIKQESLEEDTESSSSSVSEEENSDNSENCRESVSYLAPDLKMATPNLPHLDLDDENLPTRFRLFKFIHAKMMDAAKVPETDAKTRSSNFISHLPEQAQIVIMDHVWKTGDSPEDQTDIDTIIKVVCESKRKKTTRIIARNKFFNRTMKKGEKFADFKVALYAIAERCGFPDNFKEELLRDKIIGRLGYTE